MLKQTADFADQIAVWMFAALCFLYLGQLIWAFLLARNAIAPKDRRPQNFSFHLIDCLRIYDDGYRNIWVYAILAVILPIFLNSTSNLVNLVDQRVDASVLENALGLEGQSEELHEIIVQAKQDVIELQSRTQAFASEVEHDFDLQDRDFPEQRRVVSLLQRFFEIQQTQTSLVDERLSELDRATKVLAETRTTISKSQDGSAATYIYYLCLSCITILITLEFSYLHTLRKSAPEWVAMLLSALVIDFITLIGLIILVGHPDYWQPSPDYSRWV